MKVFVYSKKDNKTLAIIKGVKHVTMFDNSIHIFTVSGYEYVYNVKEVKTRIYQN